MKSADEIGRAVDRARTILGSLRHELRSVVALLSEHPRAAYIGWTGHHNLGDEVLLLAHKELLQGITLIGYRRSSLLKLLCAVTGRRLYDLGILGGGTLINQHHMWLTGVRELQNSGVPMICLGTGVASAGFWSANAEALDMLGHAGDELDDWTKALRSFSFVGVRGPYSSAALRGRGLENVDVVGDTALSLSDDADFDDRPHRRGVVGLSVGHVEHNPMWGDPVTYMDEVVKFARLMCDLGHEVQLLPVWDRDVASNEAILERVNRGGCRLRCVFDDYADYSRAVRECEVFVGQKLHSTVIACMNGVPSVMIEYRPKCRDFMASVDLEDYVIRTDQFTAETAATMVERLLRDRQAVLEKLEKRIANHRSTQSAIAGIVREFLVAGSRTAGRDPDRASRLLTREP